MEYLAIADQTADKINNGAYFSSVNKLEKQSFKKKMFKNTQILKYSNMLRLQIFSHLINAKCTNIL